MVFLYRSWPNESSLTEWAVSSPFSLAAVSGNCRAINPVAGCLRSGSVDRKQHSVNRPSVRKARARQAGAEKSKMPKTLQISAINASRKKTSHSTNWPVALSSLDEAKYARQDSNLQPSVPKTDALSNCATDACHLNNTRRPEL